MPRIFLPKLAHELIAKQLQVGDTAIDATAGNGHDSAFLLAQVGLSGHVYGFDIQAAAIAATRQKLATADNVTLVQDSHAQLAQHIRPCHTHNIMACMFNLGYLPGGDKRVITQAASTLAALTAASELLAVGGLLTVLAYPGHPDGDQETLQVAQWCGQLAPERFNCRVFASDADNPAAPRLWVLGKAKEWVGNNSGKR
ncbi:MAG: class I SAM-dependent methyltransferase [Methylovulum sp.]|nr:class I SAM-dependent methyltransferase [Methylovulum sp.]